LLSQLRTERSSNRQIALLRFVYPLMRKQDAGIIRNFLKHPEREHRQAARALLMALTLNPKYIPKVESDLEWILAHPPSEENADIAESCSGLIPPGFCDYEYLARFTPYQGFPSQAEREARAPLLPFFRWVIQKVKNPKIRWALGIKPLAFFGNESDLPLLEAISPQVNRIYQKNFESALSRIRMK
jgi:hypothetical protein